MSSNQQTPAWPFLAILICLFALSVTAPRAWEGIASKDPLASVLDAHQREHCQAQFSRLQLETMRSSITRVLPVVLDSANHINSAQIGVIEATGRALGLAMIPRRTEADVPISIPHAQAYAHQAQAPPAVEPVPDTPVVPTPVTARIERLPRVKIETWPRPAALIEQLTALRDKPNEGPWAIHVLQQIEALCALPVEQYAAARAHLDALTKLSAEAQTVAAGQRAKSIQRICYALDRRLPLWRAIAAQGGSRKIALDPTAKDYESIATAIAAIRGLAAQSPQGTRWVDYLMLDKLDAAGRQSAPERRHLADEFQRRLNSPKLDDSQRLYLTGGTVAKLATALRRWQADPASPLDVLTHLETFERTQLTSDANRIADDIEILRASENPTLRSVATSLENDYRNANLRIVVNGALINQFVPQPTAVEAPVNDVIVGAQVYGQSTTFTKLFVRLLPDEQNVRLGLEATGTVSSNTASTSGPATFYTNGESSFVVRKLFVYDKRGLRLWPAEAEADNYYNGLCGLETNFDGVPLFGSIVRNIARSQQQESLGQARMEVEGKVAFRAQQQLDSEVEPRLMKAASKLREGTWTTLKQLSLEPEPVGMSTTADRLAMRLRLATTEQLAGYTPRPRAPSDSQFSIQIHQSAMGNAAEQLDLNGRTFTLPALFDWLAKRLNSKSDALHEELPEDVSITFAEKDAVRIRAAAGRVEVVLAVKELTQGRNHWHDFTVRAEYAPTKNGNQPQLVREGTIYLDGESLRGKTHFVLRTIFSKTLSRSRPVNLLGEKLTSDPRLAHLELRQFDIEDGWIGLAYCDKPQQAEVASRPK